MTLTSKLAGAVCATVLASGAQAATFDFEFFAGEIVERPVPVTPELPIRDDVAQTMVLDEEPEPIGVGVMSYDGPATPGITALEDLENLTLSFQIGDFSFDEDDIAPTPFDVNWSVSPQDGFLSGAFISEDFEIGIADVQSIPASEPLCGLIGSILLFNGEQCLTASPFDGFPDEYAIYAADSMIELRTVSAMPEFGTYRAVARQGNPTSPVPLPASLPMLALALGGVGYLRRRKG